MARPRPERLEKGVVRPERVTPEVPREGDDQRSIEIDHERERPGQEEAGQEKGGLEAGRQELR